ncbi:MAG TPA: MarR family transcriptional regulator [Caulobacteraceae bacterium]|nr:MarR family transcriptional regulator [Caulobacteraceae bacterium]
MTDQAAGEQGLDIGPLASMPGFQIRRAHLAVMRRFAEVLGPEGVAPGQYGLLKLISLNPGRTQSALAATLGFDRSTMVPLLDQMEKRGLVERTRSTDNRRNNEVRVTPEGLAYLARIEPRMAELETGFSAALSGSERTTLLKLIDKVRLAAEG